MPFLLKALPKNRTDTHEAGHMRDQSQLRFCYAPRIHIERSTHLGVVFWLNGVWIARMLLPRAVLSLLLPGHGRQGSPPGQVTMFSRLLLLVDFVAATPFSALAPVPAHNSNRVATWYSHISHVAVR
jgi:hypothetical protein